MKPQLIGKPLTAEARYIQAARERILQWAGTKWALHPANATRRATPPPKPFFGPV
jgi:hypothetical protein